MILAITRNNNVRFSSLLSFWGMMNLTLSDYCQSADIGSSQTEALKMQLAVRRASSRARRMRVLLACAVVLANCLLSLDRALADQVTAFNSFDAAAKVSKIVLTIAPDQRVFFIREFRGQGFSDVGLAKLIGDALEKEGRSIERGAAVEVEGRLFRLPTDESLALVGFQIQGMVILPDGKLRNFTVNVENKDDALGVVGKTGESSPPPNKNAGDDLPPAEGPALVGNEVRPSPTSPYGVEVLVEERPGSFRPAKVQQEDEHFSVSLKPGDLYAVRLHNRTDFEAAASVMVDGLSRFALASDPKRSNSRDLIAAKSDRTISGYFRDGKIVDAFQVGEYSESIAAAKLPKSNDGGTLVITFATAWKDGDRVPPHEPDVNKSAPLGTKAGPPRDDPTQSVSRNIGAVRAVVRIRY